MPRVIKHPDVRRQELLDCAQTLFFERGYEQASLNDVIAAAGSSKGAFYHHFSSKEELLEALAARLARQALALVRDTPEEADLDALSRLNGLLAKLGAQKMAAAETSWALFGILYRPENLVLFHRINDAVGAMLAPLVAGIIEQGIGEGVFVTPDPAGVADMLHQFGAATYGLVARALEPGAPAQTNKAIRLIEQRIELYGIALDRILGLPDKSIRLVEPGLIRTVMAAGRAPRAKG